VGCKHEIVAGLRAFTISILHGDEDHKQWLVDECESFIVKYGLLPENPEPSSESVDTNESS
jgi:hypothetical protein